MSVSVVANRIYQRGKVSAHDVAEMAPDLLLVEGCKPPKESEGGLVLPGDKSDHPLRACVTYRVLKVPAVMSKGNPMAIAEGDVFFFRNAVVDPFFGNDLGVADMYLGPVAVAERAVEPLKLEA